MNPAARLAVWLYKRPRLRRSWKVCSALWFGATWMLAAAPTAAAQPNIPMAPGVVPGQGMMAWTGLVDTYGVPVSAYYISTVNPLEATATQAFAQLQGLSLLNPISWVAALISGGASALSNTVGAGFISIASSWLVFSGAAWVWFLQFAISAPWLPWLGSIAQPFVSTLQAMVKDFYVMPIGLLIATGYGGAIWLTKGKGRGLGIIGSGIAISLAVYLLLSDPVTEMMSDHGVLGIGQYLGFTVAEGAINNGALVPGDGHAQLGALTALICTATLREFVQEINFGIAIDSIPGCASLWNSAIMGGQIDGPAHAMGQCYPPALAHAQQLGLGDAGWLLVAIGIESVIAVVSVWVGGHIIAIGFTALFRVPVIVVAAPVAVAPGPQRAWAKHQVGGLIVDGVEMFASTGGLAIIAVMIGAVLSDGPPGAHGPSNTLYRELFVLLIVIVSAYGYHLMLVDLRRGPGLWGRLHNWRRRIADFWFDSMILNFGQVSLTGRSIWGAMQRRHRRSVEEHPEEPALGDMVYPPPPGRIPPQPVATNN